MVDVSTIYLVDGATGSEVRAELRDAIEDAQLVDWQLKWRPAHDALIRELIQNGVSRQQWPQSWHWDWPRKAARVQGLLAFRGFCVLVGGETQGMAQVDLTKSARAPAQAGKPMVYVEYLEAAPWNSPELGRVPRYRGVGTALLSAAVALSVEEGFKGRIGLHSLPQADDFYRRRGMVDLGPDPDPGHQRLRYFEMTAEQARAFLAEE
jgi:GNAT superfamily N-acetyltransferase